MPAGTLSTFQPTNLGPSFFLDPTKWDWISGITDAPDEDTFGQDGVAIANIQGWLLDYRNLNDALVFFMGYSYCDGTILNRRLPNYHPRWPYLRCTNVSIKGVKLIAEQAEPFPTFYEDSLPLPIYSRYRFSLHYEGLPYDVRSDVAVADLGMAREWSRFVTIEPVDEVEIITQEGGMFRYVSTVGTINNTPFLGPALQIRAQRAGLMVTAYGIASDFILDSSGLPTKFLQAKCLVNSATFLGKPAETLLLAGFKITKKPQYIATQNSTSGTGLLMFACKIEMHFVYTDPSATDPAETHRGWNLAPGPGGVGWFYVQSGATLLGVTIPGRSLYYKCDMNALLTHQSLNDLGVTP